MRVPSKFLEKSGITTKKKMKVRVPSKFLKTRSQKVRMLTSLLDKEEAQASCTFEVSQACRQEASREKQEEDKVGETERRMVMPLAESSSRNSSALNKLKRFVRKKRGGVKVHPINDIMM